MTDMTGKSLGRYQVQKQLGEGGMASVFVAYDPRLERTVAIKVIRSEKTSAPSFYARFELEAKSLARLSHPNIIKVLDYGDADGTPYLVMEYFQGGTLLKKLAGAMPYAEAAGLLAPIARALEYAHQNKIIHRDIKPANILLSESGTPMLSDFGIAKLLEGDQGLTATGVGIGTPEYTAPEQATGQPIDQRTDIYSLGIVFYELLTGRKPFQADTPLAVVYKQVNDPPPPPHQFAAGIPAQVEQVLMKALAKRPEDRYQDMGDFAGQLEALSQGNAKAAPLPATPSRRRRTILLILVLVPLLLVLLCCGSLWAMYYFGICIPPGPWPSFPWCGVKIAPDYNRLICPPPGPWPLPPWCGG